MWMNEYDVVDAVERYAADPVLGPAVLTLRSLVIWTNENSDGWAYWKKPGNAAKALMTLVQNEDRRRRAPWGARDLPVAATAADVAKALRPVKAFRTRMLADFTIVDFPQGCVRGL